MAIAFGEVTAKQSILGFKAIKPFFDLKAQDCGLLA